MNIVTKPINEKLSETVLFIIERLSDCKNLGLKKLAKLLYFANFNYYKKNYSSITGESYSRFEHGPFPKELYAVITSLKNKGLIKVRKLNILMK